MVLPFCCWYPGREGLRALGSLMPRGRIRCARRIRWCIISPRIMRTAEIPGFKAASGIGVPGTAMADPERTRLPRRAAVVHARRRDFTGKILISGATIQLRTG